MDFVAEVSSNHNRDLERCMKFIDAAADVGCSAVKFQLFKVDQLFIPEVVSARQDIQNRRKWELPLSFLPSIFKRCREKNLKLACTPFYLEAVGEIEPFVDFYKIASYELLWTDLLKACARTGLPVVLSTGMATLDEVKKAVDTLSGSGCRDITLLHCTSGYPAPVEQCNLAAIKTMRDAFGFPVGWSDHSVQPGVIYRAVQYWGASMVEFHLDLEGKGEEFGPGHCWLPDQIGAVISNLTIAEGADGNGEKMPAEIEAVERSWRADPADGLRPLKTIRNRVIKS